MISTTTYRFGTIRTLVSAVLLTVLTATFALPARAQTASFQSLGEMPGTQPGFGAVATGISGDGSTIIGYAWVCPAGGTTCDVSTLRPEAFRWTVTGKFHDLGNLGNTSIGSTANAASFDGSVIVGLAPPPGQNLNGAFRWTATTGMQPIRQLGTASAITPDGTMIVGFDNWLKATGQTGIFGPFPGNQDQTDASGISGTEAAPIAVGAAFKGFNAFGPANHAFRWTPASGLQDLGLTTGTESIAEAISENGLVIVGQATDINGFWRAFRWTASTGMVDLGTLPGGPESAAFAVSKDGSVIVGASLTSGSSASNHAFRWTAKTGMQDLKAALDAVGVHAADNWVRLENALGISADGTVITGTGTGPKTAQFPFGESLSFRIVLPLP